jgi:hypothetical protein
LAKAMRYALAHWDGLILYLDDGRLEMGGADWAAVDQRRDDRPRVA